MANLVENALKFAATRISVSVAADGLGVVVDDDGPGIAPDDVAHVFEPFYQSDRAAARQVGSGLGLAIVAELAAAMGGSVRAEPLTPGGTRVVVTLPRWRTAAPVG